MMNFDDFEFDDIDEQNFDVIGLIDNALMDKDELKALGFLKKILVSNHQIKNNIHQFKEFLYIDFLSKLSEYHSENIKVLSDELDLLMNFYEFSQKNSLLNLPNNTYNEITHNLSLKQINLLLNTYFPNDNNMEILSKLSLRLPISISYSNSDTIFITNELGGFFEVVSDTLIELEGFLSYTKKINNNFYDIFSIAILTSHKDFKNKSIKLIASKDSDVVNFDILSSLINSSYDKYNIKNIVNKLKNHIEINYKENTVFYHKKISLINKAILDESCFSEEELKILKDDLKHSQKISKNMVMDERKIFSVFEELSRYLNIQL